MNQLTLSALVHWKQSEVTMSRGFNKINLDSDQLEAEIARLEAEIEELEESKLNTAKKILQLLGTHKKIVIEQHYNKDYDADKIRITIGGHIFGPNITYKKIDLQRYIVRGKSFDEPDYKAIEFNCMVRGLVETTERPK